MFRKRKSYENNVHKPQKIDKQCYVFESALKTSKYI